MKLNKEDKKKLSIGFMLLVLLLIVVFAYGKMQGLAENEEREIDVIVDIKDENGQTVSYDPNPLLVRLNKGLTTRYYFDFSERCDSIKELYSLDSVRFVAVVKAYKEKYGVDIQVHMRACYVDCNVKIGVQALNHFDLIYDRIEKLKDIIQ